MKRFSLIILLIVMVSNSVATAKPKPTTNPPTDRWYVLRMSGSRVGYLHVQETAKPGEVFVTERLMVMKIKRGKTVLETRIESSSTEHLNERTFAGQSLTTSGNTKVQQQFKYKGNAGIDYEVSQNGQKRKGTIAVAEQALLGGEMARHYFVKQHALGKTLIQYHTFDLGTAFKIFRVDVRVKGKQEVELFGRVVPVIETAVVNSAMPTVTSQDFVDAKGRLVKSVVELAPGMKMEMLLANRDLAMAEIDPPEIIASTMITADKPIRGPRQTRKATFLLTLKGRGDGFVELPTAGFQVVIKDGETLRVHVDLDKPVSGKHVKADKPTAWHLRASTICDSEDEKVIALAKKALKNLGDDAKHAVKADRLRAFVQRYVRSKDLSVGFGHASEVARTRQGDCTEHAVLLAALLRAAGIPSRGVTGLVYADQFIGKKEVFAFHMWTQAWIADPKDKASGGHWIDLDATLPGRAFDATHIALGTSVLNELTDGGAGNDMIKLLPLLGRLQIKVLEIE